MMDWNKAAIAAMALLAAAVSAGCGPGGPDGAVKNQPPLITDARIVPEQPVANSVVTVQIAVSDPEGDAVTLTTEWFVNGRLASAGEESQFLTRGLAPGDRIKARVTPADSSGAGAPRQTPEVVVQENLSGFDSVRLSPSPVRSGSGRVRAELFLAAGASPNLKVTYRWSIAGKDQSETGPEVNLPGLKAGDQIAVEATASIGGQKGNPFRVAAIVTNDAPAVQSIALAFQDAAFYMYQVTATDPDNDPLSYQLVSGPAGAAIDGSGLITVPVAAAGQPIRIKVGDNAGNWIERNLETGK
jgi:hypothetical protein